MSEISSELTGGLSPEQDYFLPKKPDNPEMRESTSIWLYEENGVFAIPRIGIEGEASHWDNRMYHGNFAMGGGRVLRADGRGAPPSAIDTQGRPTVFGAGPLKFYTVEPFHKTRVTFDSAVIDTTAAAQIARSVDESKQTKLSFEVDLTMVTPAWVQDNSADKVATMSKEDAANAASMGIGYRFEHLFRGEGTLHLDGKSRTFKAIGIRVHRQSVRPLDAFSGHVWQSALFPDGSAFGLCVYPPKSGDKVYSYNDAFVYQDGKMFKAQARVVKFLPTPLIEENEDVSFELEYERGVVRIAGRTCLSTYHIFENYTVNDIIFSLQQGSARYDWDGQIGYGMIERSVVDKKA